MDWMDQAACKGQGHLFFAPAGERPGARDRRQAEAFALCKVCPVADRCGTYAATLDALDGIWAGEAHRVG
jgi:hypothetical protein